MTQFIPHGEVAVSRDGRIMTVEGRGPWNLEAVKRSEQAAQTILRDLSGGPWGVVIVIYGEPIHVPDAKNRLVELVKQDIENGRVATALVVGECDSPNFAKNHLGSIYQDAGDNLAFFEDVTQARSWIQKQIEETSGKKLIAKNGS